MVIPARHPWLSDIECAAGLKTALWVCKVSVDSVIGIPLVPRKHSGKPYFVPTTDRSLIWKQVAVTEPLQWMSMSLNILSPRSAQAFFGNNTAGITFIPGGSPTPMYQYSCNRGLKGLPTELLKLLYRHLHIKSDHAPLYK